MHRKTKKLIKVWRNRFLITCLLGMLVWINADRLQENLYPNYEKAVDYGRVREKKDTIDPIIIAIFYDHQKNIKRNISTYLDHSDN